MELLAGGLVLLGLYLLARPAPSSSIAPTSNEGGGGAVSMPYTLNSNVPASMNASMAGIAATSANPATPPAYPPQVYAGYAHAPQVTVAPTSAPTRHTAVRR